MQWDIFCKVIDNFGDVGVCWRLVSGLAARGHTCRLWIDDASALRWMAPQVNAEGLGHSGIEVLPWPSADEAMAINPGDVVIEAFGCDLPDAWVARMQRPMPPTWINLEYFSAETYVERSHGLPSPVMHGPGNGLRKFFFFPGVNERTGGLMRPSHLTFPMDPAYINDSANRQAVLASHGISWRTGERVVNVFCYEHAPLHAWLQALEQACSATCHVLLMSGAAQTLGGTWQATAQASGPANHLKLHPIPAISQAQFDALLSAADLNIVRGEDSAVSALWAGRPHLWHIYHQDDGAHAPKLAAFMDHWMRDWPAALRANVQQVWRAFNGLATVDQLQHMATLWQTDWAAWQANSRLSSQQQAQESDLITRLLAFIDGLS
jgi:uncharacterized repeat protein (TIGR03837 family)